MFIASLVRLFLSSSVAHANTLDTVGTRGAGVSAMWQMITGQFSLSGKSPSEAVAFFTSRIITFAFSIIGALAVGLVMYAGIRLILGGEEGRDEAKKIVQYTLFGVVLALIAFVAVAFVVGILHSLLS